MRQLESFFWGIIAALGALFFQLIIYIGFSTYAYPLNATPSFSEVFAIPTIIIISAAIEEIFKYTIISKQIDFFSHERTYIINSFFVGLGFFATEFALIYMSVISTMPIKSLIEIAIIHVGCAGLLGFFVATRNPKKISTFLYAITVATLFHGSYNFLVGQEKFALNYVVVFILITLMISNIYNLINIKVRLAQD